MYQIIIPWTWGSIHVRLVKAIRRKAIDVIQMYFELRIFIYDDCIIIFYISSGPHTHYTEIIVIL